MTKRKKVKNTLIAEDAVTAAACKDAPPSVEPSAKPKRKASTKAAALPYPEDAPKHTRMLVLLKRMEGASIAELQSATQWQAHSVRGFLSAIIRKKLQLPLVTEMRTGGERIYRIASAQDA